MSVRIEHIHLKRLRGTAAALDVQQLAPDINVIHGPNGVGKSTLALALQETLWPGSTGLDRPTLSARLHADGTPWNVSIESGHAEYDGPDGGRPDFGSPDRRGRYLIALHDLIMPESETDTAFAERVLRESLGGYDLDAAARKLGYSASPTQRQKLKSELKEAQRGVEQALSRARALETKRRALADLRTQRAAATAAYEEADVIQRVLGLVTARTVLENAKGQLDALPEAAGRLRGNESEALEALRKREAELEGKIRQAERELARLDREISEAAFEGGAPDEATMGHWKGLLTQAEETERSQRAHREERSRAEAALREIDVRLHGDLEADSDRTLSRDGARALVRLFSDWVQSDSQRVALDQRERFLEDARSKLATTAPVEGAPAKGDLADGAPSADTLKIALRQLEKWLRSVPAEARQSKGAAWAMALAAVGVFTGLVAAFVAGPVFLVASVLASLLYVLYRRSAIEIAASGRADIERMWGETGISPPHAWSDEAVRALHSDLSARLIKAERRMHDALTLDAQRQALDEERRTWETERRHLSSKLQDQCRQLGWRLKADDESAEHDGMAAVLWMNGLSEELVLRGEKQAALTTARAAEEAAEMELDRLLADLAGLTRALGIDAAPSSAASARKAWEEMERRVSKLSQAEDDRRRTHRQVAEEWGPALVDIQQQLAALFVGVGLAPGDDTGLSRLLDMRTAWISAKNELGIAEHEVSKAEKAVDAADVPEIMEEGVDALLTLREEELRSRLEMRQVQAATYNELTQQIEETRATLKEAVGRQDVARAVAARDAAEEALARALAANRRSMVGNEVARFVREVTVKDTLPQVFTRARDLLTGFTAGALELEVDLDSTPPRFLARTDGMLRARPVAELSVGERVQLLMAVRMAFLEQEETSPLPLILDETLGTTDDERAQSVLGALLDLAGRGRQLFYFTAQSDEVAKWLDALHDLPGSAEDRIVDLAAVRLGTAQKAAPLPRDVEMVTRSAVPVPEGPDHRAYGKLLGVPGIRPHEETVASVHIWHVMETAEEVYRLLLARVHTVGQFRRMANSGHPVTGSEDERAVAAQRIDVVEDAMALWKQGRGRPLTLDVLEAAPGVSDRKLPEVWDLARTRNGDATALIEGLEEGKVSRFREDKREELRAYLEEEGYIPEVEPLTASDAITQLQVRHPDAHVAYVERVVATLWP